MPLAVGGVGPAVGAGDGGGLDDAGAFIALGQLFVALEFFADSVELVTLAAVETGGVGGVAMQLDSGNTAFKAKDYAAARKHYNAVIKIDDEQPAGWFGIYMVELAEGNGKAAEEALKRAQKLMPGASLIHPEPGSN